MKKNQNKTKKTKTEKHKTFTFTDRQIDFFSGNFFFVVDFQMTK